jgi:phosphopantothenoylcysteine synthetase/decarboxylase
LAGYDAAVRFKLTLEYAGTRYSGWQKQTNARTVQGELERAVAEALRSADVLVMAAAPADFGPASPRASKQPRSEGALAIPMEPTDDVLGATEARRKPGSVTVGFALETGDAVEARL